MRVGIVAVHGVIPQVRYGFQDQVATKLCDALNARNDGRSWKMRVVLPKNGSAGVTDVPTISRVLGSGDAPDAPSGDYFDVHEAYWSPIDKGKTTFVRVLYWLLGTVFLPFNDFARYREKPLKAMWDLGYVCVVMAIGIGLILLSALNAAQALRDLLGAMCLATGTPPPVPTVHCLTSPPPPFDLVASIVSLFHGETWRQVLDFQNLFAMLALLLSPLTLLKSVTPPVFAGLVLGLIGAYLAFQAARAAWFIVSNVAEFVRRDPIQFISRLAWTAALALLAFLALRAAWTTTIAYPNGVTGTLAHIGMCVVVSVATFTAGRTYLTWFVTNFFGDVQIYTTRNQNSDFFALREQILEKVVNVILGVLTTAPAGEAYERVYILAHSLGSTISMDALLRLYDMQAASDGLPNAVLPAGDWKRLRGFVTFGTSLEKTKYFFNAWNATQSQDWEQWNGAIYGAVFTADPLTLAGADASAGVFWHNNWFFSDFVADQITTYRSFLLPGEPISKNASAIAGLRGKNASYIGRLVAFNRSRFGPFPQQLQTHTAYLDREWFWKRDSAADFAVLDVLDSREPADPPGDKVADDPVSEPARGQKIPGWQAPAYKSWEVAR